MSLNKQVIPGSALSGAFLVAVLPLILIMGFFAYTAYDEMVSEPIARQKLTEVEKEFQQIRPLPGATTTSDSGITFDPHHVTVGHLYQTNLTFSEIRAYYDAELAKHGWKFEKESNVNGPDGQYHGGKQVFYSKGEFTAFIHHVGEQTKYGYTYYFRVSWDS